MLPHKQYGLAVIASMAAAHVEFNQSLRAAAWTTHTGQTPAHSTLHAWTEGLGAFVLGRPFGSLPGAYPYQAVVAATTARWSDAGQPIESSAIDPRRHRSDARRERLVAVADILAMARAVVAVAGLALVDAEPPLCAVRRLAIDLGVPQPFAFRTGIGCTPFEHGVGSDRESPGQRRRVPRSTLHRWLAIYKQHGIRGLMPQPRRDRGKQKTGSRDVIDHAIRLLLEQPNRSLQLVSGVAFFRSVIVTLFRRANVTMAPRRSLCAGA